MRRTLASPIFAISSNSPSAIFAEALSASMRTARRGERFFEGHTHPFSVMSVVMGVLVSSAGVGSNVSLRNQPLTIVAKATDLRSIRRNTFLGRVPARGHLYRCGIPDSLPQEL